MVQDPCVGKVERLFKHEEPEQKLQINLFGRLGHFLESILLYPLPRIHALRREDMGVSWEKIVSPNTLSPTPTAFPKALMVAPRGMFVMASKTVEATLVSIVRFASTWHRQLIVGVWWMRKVR